MRKINVYITFNGNCEEAFRFYKSVFGGDFQFIGRYKDVPPSDKEIFHPENEDKIMHVSLPISKETILMGCDNAEANGRGTVVGDNVAISIDIDGKDEADQLFAALSVGAKIKMLMAQTFWGAYFGALTDQFGINWLINCDAKKDS
jgi:PhnB protein